MQMAWGLEVGRMHWEGYRHQQGGWAVASPWAAVTGFLGCKFRGWLLEDSRAAARKLAESTRTESGAPTGVHLCSWQLHTHTAWRREQPRCLGAVSGSPASWTDSRAQGGTSQGTSFREMRVQGSLCSVVTVVTAALCAGSCWESKIVFLPHTHTRQVHTHARCSHEGAEVMAHLTVVTSQHAPVSESSQMIVMGKKERIFTCLHVSPGKNLLFQIISNLDTRYAMWLFIGGFLLFLTIRY